MKIVALIPARGGSKGIPNKNIKDFCGKPLIAHSIEAAKQSIFINEQYGLLCDPSNKVALTEVIKNGLEKDWDNESIIEYSKIFSWKNIFSNTRELY